MDADEKSVLRDLARQYLAVCHDEIQDVRRDLWRRHNSLERTRPLVYVRAFAWQEMAESECVCQDPFFRAYEDLFRRRLFWASLDDDSVFEPWVSVDAVHVVPPEGPWGMSVQWIAGDHPRGAKRMRPPIVEPEDAARMAVPQHRIDEVETARRADRLRDAIGDLITVHVERAPFYRRWNGDISTQLAQLRGIDQLMMDMMIRPDWLHEVLALMRDGILRAQDDAEVAGDWTLSAHENQAMPYALELADPMPGGEPVTRDRLWYFCASQETTLVGPEMFREFMLEYQWPIMERFGLLAYGCCEDLTLKLPFLKGIPNLRRIAVSPMANVARCAEQIGADYVLSYRPSPSDMVGYDYDPERVDRILRRDLGACDGCHVDITLKDVETVQGDPARVRRWVGMAKRVIDDMR